MASVVSGAGHPGLPAVTTLLDTQPHLGAHLHLHLHLDLDLDWQVAHLQPDNTLTSGGGRMLH